MVYIRTWYLSSDVLLRGMLDADDDDGLGFCGEGCGMGDVGLGTRGRGGMRMGWMR